MPISQHRNELGTVIWFFWLWRCSIIAILEGSDLAGYMRGWIRYFSGHSLSITRNLQFFAGNKAVKRQFLVVFC